MGVYNRTVARLSLPPPPHGTQPSTWGVHTHQPSSVVMSIEGENQLADQDKGQMKLMIKAEGEGKWRVQAKVGNNMSCVVTESDGVFTGGPVMSTRMMPPPELQQLENDISELLSELTNISKDGDVLVIEGAGKSEQFTAA